MATLTPSEVTYIRAMSGDTCEDYDVAPDLLQALHDRGLTMTDCACTDSLDLDVVLVLRVRVAKAAKLFNEDGEGGTRSVSQKYDHLKEMLSDWETRCGLSGGVFTISTLDLGLDAECDGSENASWPYASYLFGGSR